MAEYRDIGYINNYPQVNQLVDTTRRSQVYQATHKGEQVLPFMYRSFISFTFGGKRIEDFNLIATISGDRLNRPGYASFNDTVTTYDNLDGQHYWATHYKTNQLDFTLSTDGIDQRQLDNFLHWFRAGATRELILAEHPNRAIMARVSSTPTLNLLPFETSVEVTLSRENYKTKTTLYKGDISLSLVMDTPHWYAIVNILGIKENNRYIDKWHDVTTNQDVWIIESQDALKVLYEDGIPLGSMIEDNMLLGNGAYARVETDVISLTWSEPEDSENFLEGEGALIDAGYEEGHMGDSEYYEDHHGTVGIIAGAMIDINGDGITTLDAGSDAYFFYAGTAPAYTAITFTLTPSINEDGYINVPQNSYINAAQPYNEIIIESVHSQTLRFTTPNFYTSYNKAIEIFKKMVNQPAYAWEDVRMALRNQVRHSVIREYANTLIYNIVNTPGDHTTASTDLAALESNMANLLKKNQNEFYSATFTFNSETGEAVGYFSYNMNGEQHRIKEDVGDMLRSNYIILSERNYPTPSGKIMGWINTDDTTKSYSHRFRHNVSSGLTNIQILYKNMYL